MEFGDELSLSAQVGSSEKISIHHVEFALCHREELEYVANTLIFVLSGVIITGKIWESSSSAVDSIRPADYGYAVLLWVYLLVRHKPIYHLM